MNYPSVSIVFPCFNGKVYTLRCLDSIYKLNYPQNKIEVIVIDNGSSDGSSEKIKKKFPKVRLIRFKENRPITLAHNTGIKRARGKYIFHTDNDIILDKNSLTELVKFMESSPETGIVGGKIYFIKPKNKLAFAGSKFNPFLGWAHHTYEEPDKIKSIAWVQGCAMLFRKSLINEIGLFDENYYDYWEDFDFCFRAIKKGYKVIYLPKAVIWHGGGSTTTKTGNKPSRNKLYLGYKGKFYFFLKNLPTLQKFTAVLFHLTIVTVYNHIKGKESFLLKAKALLESCKMVSK